MSRNRAKPRTRWPRCATPKAHRQRIAAIVNVRESSIAREAETVWPTYAGPGSASPRPKRSLASSRCWRRWPSRRRARAATSMRRKSSACARSCWRRRATWSPRWSQAEKIEALGQRHRQAQDVLYLGRGVHFPLALEGALKLKEISYIHAEGYAAGEMKHGPIALIDQNVPIIVIAPFDALFEKTISNMHEVMARAAAWC